jgi:hypothetical protein
LAAPKMKSSGRSSTKIDMEVIRRLNTDDTDAMIRLLELNEDRLCQWMVLDSATVVREDLDGSIEYVKALRKMIKAERPDYVSPYTALLPF